MKVLLGLRHAEVKNPGNVAYGHLPGFCLSPQGRDQARTLGEALAGHPIRAIYCSPLERAVETAEIVGQSLSVPIIPDDRLIEWHFWKSFQGREWSDDLIAEFRELRQILLTNPDDTQTGESFNQLQSRLRAWVDDMVNEPTEAVVLGVTHFDTLRALMLELLGLKVDHFRSIIAGHCELFRLYPNPHPQPFSTASIASFLDQSEHVSNEPDN